jgi:hypothetical protein
MVGVQVGDPVVDRGGLEHQLALVDDAEQVADREQSFLLKVADEGTDVAGEVDRVRGLGGAAGQRGPVEDQRDGQRRDQKERDRDEYGELAANA